jgi:hypothetical protein
LNVIRATVPRDASYSPDLRSALGLHPQHGHQMNKFKRFYGFCVGFAHPRRGNRGSMARSIGPMPLPELGDGLPLGTRFCFPAPDRSISFARGNMVAVVPCKRFKQDGLYLLHAPNGVEVRNCRAVENGREIEIISPGGKTTVSKELFCEIVEGRVIGIASLALVAESRKGSQCQGGSVAEAVPGEPRRIVCPPSRTHGSS